MQSKFNQRSELRLKFKNSIQYEERLENELFSTPVITKTIDIGVNSIGFHAYKEFKLNSQLRITCHVSENEQIAFIVSVSRIQINRRYHQQFIVGAEIIDISEADREKLKILLDQINIHGLLDTIDMDNVADIHFISGYPIILKKAGKLRHVGEVLDEFRIKNLLFNLLDEANFARFMKVKDINFILIYKEKRLRFNMHFQQGRVEAVCRIVNKVIPTPAQLGLPPIIEQLVKNNSKGLILISGRTGSGKSTTLASLVAYLTKVMSGVIITIEDPIEYIQDRSQCVVKQRELGEDTVSYISAVRNALRQNPDVLILGEILDKETIDLLLLAAESGVLVFTTFHSPSVPQVLDRIISFFPADAQRHVQVRLSLTLKGIIVQELFPKVMEEGLVLATEVFVINESARKMIRDGDWKQIPDLILRGKAQGSHTMKDSIENLVNRGLIDHNFLNEYYRNLQQ